MTLYQKQRIMPLAMATLCIVAGVMSLLFVVYYANAINNQNQSANQITTLQSQIATRDSQITSLNTQLSSLNTQVNTLTADKQYLQDQVNSLQDTVNTLSQQVAQLEAAIGPGPSRGGARAYKS